MKKVFFKILLNLQENNSDGVSFWINLQAWYLQTLLKKETPTQGFSCELCEIFIEDTYFAEKLWFLRYWSCNMVWSWRNI